MRRTLIAACFFCLVAITAVAQRPARQAESFITSNEARTQTKLALEHDRAGRYAEAINAYQRALKSAPNDAGLYNNLGNALASAGRFDEAIGALQRARELNSDFRTLVHINLAFVYAQLNRKAEAFAALKEATAAKSKSIKEQAGLCELQLVLEQNREATACYEHLLPLAPADARAYANLGIALIVLERYDVAIAHLLDTIKRFPNHACAFSALGSALLYRGRKKEAIVSLKQALELDPLHGPAHFSLGLAQLANNDRRAAIEQYVFLKQSNSALAQRLYERIFGGRIVFAERK